VVASFKKRTLGETSRNHNIGKRGCMWMAKLPITIEYKILKSLLFEPSSVIDCGWWIMTEGKK
jgi:hypothetical protein